MPRSFSVAPRRPLTRAAAVVASLTLLGGMTQAATAAAGTPTSSTLAVSSQTAGFRPVTPVRVLDSRDGTGVRKARVGPGSTVTFDPRRGGVPADASAVVLNVTGVAPSSGTYLTVFPGGTALPEASNLNLRPGQVVANSATVALGGGTVSVYNAVGTVDVVADVTGYYRAGAGQSFVPLERPTRPVDTRPGAVGPPGRLGAGQSGTYSSGVPAGATAVVLNLTGVLPSRGTYLTAWPAGVGRPVASTLNLVPGDVAANLAVVGVDAAGRFSVYNDQGTIDLIADVTGYYTASVPAPSAFRAQAPVRMLDTRLGAGAPPAQVGPGGRITLTVSDTRATAAVLNLTGVSPSRSTFVTAHPAGAAQPGTSNLNLKAGEVRPNAVVVGVRNGQITLYNSEGALDLVVDLLGMFGPDGMATPAAPPPTVPTVRPVPSVLEATDFASSSLLNAWDFSDAADSRTGGTQASISGGQLHYAPQAVQPPLLYFMQSSIARPEDGPNTPIDGNRYTTLTMRLKSDRSAPLGVAWAICEADTPACRGFFAFTGKPGWNTYVLDVPAIKRSQASTSSYQATWSHPRIISLRLAGSAQDVDVDYVRLTGPVGGINQKVTWDDPRPGGAATLYWDTDGSRANNTADNPGWGVLASYGSSAAVNTATFPAGRHPAGDYRFYVVKGSATSPDGVGTIRAQAQPEVLSPSRAGGEDYATRVRGNAWDFSDASDYAVVNARQNGLSGGVLTATSTNNDPRVVLTMGAPINGNRYHRFSARVLLTGPFSLGGQPGGGTVGRIVWTVASGGSGASTQYQTSDDIVLYPGWNDVFVELATNPPGAVVDPSAGFTRIGWAGQQITSVRFDPHEDPGARTFALDSVRITADNEGTGSSVVTFTDRAWRPGTTADVLAVDPAGNEVVVARDFAMSAGTNAVRYTPPAGPGTQPWTIKLVVTHPGEPPVSTRSTGPVRITV